MPRKRKLKEFHGKGQKGTSRGEEDHDITKPKRPIHPFILFRKQHFDNLKGQNGAGVCSSKGNASAKQAWEKLSEAEKAQLMNKYKEDLQIYKESIKKLGKTASFDKAKREITIRSSPCQLLKLVSKLDDNKKDAIREIGFGGLLEIQCHSMPSCLLTWLIQHFNPTQCHIQLGGGQILQVTARDVEITLGIPGSGPIPKEDEDASEEEVDIIPRRYKWIDLLEELIRMESGEEFKKKFVIFVCGCLLAPSKRAEHTTKLWRCLHLVEEIRNMNWAEYVRIKLCSQLQDFQLKRRKYVGGCIFFLMVFYLDRVSILNHHVHRTMPRVKAWTDSVIQERITIEMNTHRQYGFGKIEAQFDDNFNTCHDVGDLRDELFVRLANSGFIDVAAVLAAISNIPLTIQSRVVNVGELLCGKSTTAVHHDCSRSEHQSKDILLNGNRRSKLTVGVKRARAGNSLVQEQSPNQFENEIELGVQKWVNNNLDTEIPFKEKTEDVPTRIPGGGEEEDLTFAGKSSQKNGDDLRKQELRPLGDLPVHVQESPEEDASLPNAEATVYVPVPADDGATVNLSALKTYNMDLQVGNNHEIEVSVKSPLTAESSPTKNIGRVQKIDAVELIEDKKNNLQSVMNFVMLEWKDFEGHVKMIQNSVSGFFGELESGEKDLEPVQESVSKNSEELISRRKLVEERFKKLDEKEKLILELLQKVELAQNKFATIRDFVGEKLENIALQG